MPYPYKLVNELRKHPMRHGDIKEVMKLIANMYSACNIWERQLESTRKELDSLSKTIFNITEKRNETREE